LNFAKVMVEVTDGSQSLHLRLS